MFTDCTSVLDFLYPTEFRRCARFNFFKTNLFLEFLETCWTWKILRNSNLNLSRKIKNIMCLMLFHNSLFVHKSHKNTETNCVLMNYSGIFHTGGDNAFVGDYFQQRINLCLVLKWVFVIFVCVCVCVCVCMTESK